MFRAFTIIASVVALAVMASPASAGAPPKPKPAGVVGGVDALDSLMTSFAVKPPSTFGAGKDRGWVTAPPKPQIRTSGFAKVIDHSGQFTG